MFSGFRYPRPVQRWRILGWIVLSAACAGPRTASERLRHAEERALTAERALDKASAAIERLEPDQAESLVADAKGALADPDITAYPEHQLLRERVESAEKAVLAARVEVARRDTERRVKERTAKVQEAAKALQVALEKLSTPRVGASEVKGARGAVDELKDALDVDDERVKNDAGYAALFKTTMAALGGQRDEIAVAERVVALREGPLEQWRKAGERAAKATKEEDAEAKLALYNEARQAYRSCGDGLKPILSEAPKLRARAILVEGEAQELALEAIAKICLKEAQALDKVVSGLEKAAKLAAAAKAKAEAAKAKAEAAKAKAEAAKEKRKKK